MPGSMYRFMIYSFYIRLLAFNLQYGFSNFEILPGLISKKLYIQSLLERLLPVISLRGQMIAKLIHPVFPVLLCHLAYYV
jgi:hypothetical protein